MTVTNDINGQKEFFLPPIPEGFDTQEDMPPLHRRNLIQKISLDEIVKAPTKGKLEKGRGSKKKKFKVIELEPEYTASKVVDGSSFPALAKISIEGKRSKSLSRKRIRCLKDNGFPLEEKKLKKFFRAFKKNKTALLYNRDISYPAGFRVNLGITDLFFEVHTPIMQFLVIHDIKNPAAHLNSSGGFKNLLYAWPLQGEKIAYAITDLNNSPRRFQKAMKREEKFLNQFNGKTHVAKLYKTVYFDSGGRQVLIMKLYPTDLLNWCQKRINGQPTRQYTSLEKVKIAIKLATTIAYFHEHNVYHKDIKPENVLMDDMDVVITDFGLACEGDSPSVANGVSGTLSYVSYCTLKVLLNGLSPTLLTPEENDIWGLGSLLWLLFAERPMPWCQVFWEGNLRTKTKLAVSLQLIESIVYYPPKEPISGYGILWSLVMQCVNQTCDIKKIIKNLKKLKNRIQSKPVTISADQFPDLHDLENIKFKVSADHRLRRGITRSRS